MDTKISFIFLFQGLLILTAFATEEDPSLSNSAFFATEENKRLEHHVIEQIESPSLMSCSHSCLRNSWCSSTNFKMPSDKNSKGSCELNKHGAIDVNSKFADEQGVIFSLFLKGCLMTGCLNGGSCVNDEKKETFSCSCKGLWTGEKCEIKIDLASCDEAQMKANQKLPNGEYLLTNTSQPVKVYCHMKDDNKGWTLIARFSNNDDQNWMEDAGLWWYDQQAAVGTTTDPSINSDMISPAFWLVSGKEFKITRSDDPSHTPLLQTTGGCLAGQTFRSKIASYGDFRNGETWTMDNCLGSCTVQFGGQYNSTDGFQQAECSGTIQSANMVSFWCDSHTDATPKKGDGAVMMIGGGGGEDIDPCGRTDHGIGITETNQASFVLSTSGLELDFGHDALVDSSVTQAYSLNLWIS